MTADNVHVVLRVRPLSLKETKRGEKEAISVGNAHSVTVNGKTFTFDKVFPATTPQDQVFIAAAERTVVDVLNGVNGAIIAYGQTGSGKTHTMMGSDENPGLVPRVAIFIFEQLQLMDTDDLFYVKASFVEVYNEKIRDLLDLEKTDLQLKEKKGGPVVDGLSEQYANSHQDLLKFFHCGNGNRRVAETDMNSESSRSHSIFLITVCRENATTKTKLEGKLYLVDLAGSERLFKTGATGTVKTEGAHINKSLLSLGNVINALSTSKGHVPFRESKLTRILQQPLSGNSRTTVVICVSPAASNQSETLSTLQFGERAKKVKTEAKVNKKVTAEEWRTLYDQEKEKVAALEAMLAQGGRGQERSAAERKDEMKKAEEEAEAQKRWIARLQEELQREAEDEKRRADERAEAQQQFIAKLQEELLERAKQIADAERAREWFMDQVRCMIFTIDENKVSIGATSDSDVLEQLRNALHQRSGEASSYAEELQKKVKRLTEELVLTRASLKDRDSELARVGKDSRDLRESHIKMLHSLQEVMEQLTKERGNRRMMEKKWDAAKNQMDEERRKYSDRLGKLKGMLGFARPKAPRVVCPLIPSQMRNDSFNETPLSRSPFLNLSQIRRTTDACSNSPIMG